jgi:hypothetical protein
MTAYNTVCCYAASFIYHLQLRLDRFVIDFVLNLIINILLGFGCWADRFSKAGTASSRDSDPAFF